MSFLFDLLQSIVKLGLPMVLLSWFLFTQLYDKGDVDRGADRKAIKSTVKSLRAVFKARSKAKSVPPNKSHAEIVYDKWMWFGSGFYGLAALWTFVIIEVTDVFNFIVNNPGWAVLLEDGVVSLLVNVLINQLQNLLAAFVWFSFWDADSILLWVLIAYAGYWVGVEMARREAEIPVADWLGKIRLFFKSLNP